MPDRRRRPDPGRPRSSALPFLAAVLAVLVITLATVLFQQCQAGQNRQETRPPPATPGPARAANPGFLRFGINLAGAEFGQQTVTIARNPDGSEQERQTGLENRDYLYPAEYLRDAPYAALGLDLVRVPFKWERLQPYLGAPLDPAGVAGLRRVLDAAHDAGYDVILEPHNFGRHFGVPLRDADLPVFRDFWERVAREFGDHPALWGFELMNEPHDLPGGSPTWARLAQAGTDGIRSATSRPWVLVPGYDFQAANRWPQANPTLRVQDPAGRLLYAAHSYWDPDGSGRYRESWGAAAAYPEIGADHLRPFVRWLEERDAWGIVTEYGVPASDPRWLDALRHALQFIQDEPRLAGGLYWATGPWWPASDQLSLNPAGGRVQPQLAVLADFPSRRTSRRVPRRPPLT